MNSPLVSVIIPCYNAEKYIREAIDSIINQTYSNIEILCIDDCSKDNTLSMLREFEVIDNRIRVYSNPINMRIAAALNVGLEHTSGTYIARMDADDIAVHDRIEKQVKFLEAYPQIAICGGQCDVINEHGMQTGHISYPLSDEALKTLLLFDSCFAHPTVMFRKSIYNSLGGYADMMPVEDVEYWTRMAIAGYKFANLPDVLLRYRHHSLQVTSTQNDYKKIEKLKQLSSLYSSFYLNQNSWNNFNLRFFMGNWRLKTSAKDFRYITQASEEIISKNKENAQFNQKVLKKCIAYYRCRAYLSCLKSRQNSLLVRFQAFCGALSLLSTTMRVIMSK
ncbi:glycosyltransferase [Bacteroides sp. GD17]|jgi:glycosyltransferase involved in cell wall biosynthesis|uniref:glycosyltransferase family 2 protein n=1 Tax=Bacteroides sp. GD17 TaxID=3139826 RepID=UPI00313C350F